MHQPFQHCYLRGLACYLPLMLGATFTWAQVPSDQTQGLKKASQDQIRVDRRGELTTFLEQYGRTKLAIPKALRQHVIAYLESSTFEVQNLPLFEKGFSKLTQNRFKQVSKSTVDAINHLDQNKLIELSAELMKFPSLQRRAYSLYIAYMLLESTQEWSKESQMMMYSLMNDSFFEARAYLKSRFLDRSDQYLKQIIKTLNLMGTHEQVHSTLNEVILSLKVDDILGDLGFWLRRDLDQSRISLFSLVKLTVQNHLGHSTLSSFVGELPPTQDGLTVQTLNSIYEPLLKKLNSESGMYLGDLHGLLQIEGLNQGIKKALDLEKTGAKQDDFKSNSKQIKSGQPTLQVNKDELSSRSLWEMFSMHKLERVMESTEKKRPFLFLNPRFIFWINDHMVPSPKMKSLLFKLTKLYQQRYKRLGTLMYQSHMYLKSELNLNEEKLNYSLARFSAEFDEDLYLQQRYSQVLAQEFPEVGISTFTPAKAIGFWLRREIDGSAKYVWSSLRFILSQLDPNFDKLGRQD